MDAGGIVQAEDDDEADVELGDGGGVEVQEEKVVNIGEEKKVPDTASARPTRGRGRGGRGGARDPGVRDGLGGALADDQQRMMEEPYDWILENKPSLAAIEYRLDALWQSDIRAATTWFEAAARVMSDSMFVFHHYYPDDDLMRARRGDHLHPAYLPSDLNELLIARLETGRDRNSPPESSFPLYFPSTLTMNDVPADLELFGQLPLVEPADLSSLQALAGAHANFVPRRVDGALIDDRVFNSPAIRNQLNDVGFRNGPGDLKELQPYLAACYNLASASDFANGAIVLDAGAIARMISTCVRRTMESITAIMNSHADPIQSMLVQGPLVTAVTDWIQLARAIWLGSIDASTIVVKPQLLITIPDSLAPYFAGKGAAGTFGGTPVDERSWRDLQTLNPMQVYRIPDLTRTANGLCILTEDLPVIPVTQVTDSIRPALFDDAKSVRVPVVTQLTNFFTAEEGSDPKTVFLRMLSAVHNSDFAHTHPEAVQQIGMVTVLKVFAFPAPYAGPSEAQVSTRLFMESLGFDPSADPSITDVLRFGFQAARFRSIPNITRPRMNAEGFRSLGIDLDSHVVGQYLGGTWRTGRGAGAINRLPSGYLTHYQHVYNSRQIVDLLSPSQTVADSYGNRMDGLCFVRSCIILRAIEQGKWSDVTVAEDGTRTMALRRSPVSQLEAAAYTADAMQLVFKETDHGKVLPQSEWQRLADVFQHPLVVVSIEDKKPIWQSALKTANGDFVENFHRPWFLLFHDDHVSPIIAWQAFFGMKGYCAFCRCFFASVVHLQKHKCVEGTCPVCGCLHNDLLTQVVTPEARETWQACEHCFRRLPPVCHQAHKATGLCMFSWWCDLCKQTIEFTRQKPESHTCGEYKCRMCHRVVPPNHKCYIVTNKAWVREKAQPRTVLAFDFETVQHQTVHVVNYCNVQLCAPLRDDSTGEEWPNQNAVLEANRPNLAPAPFNESWEFFTIDDFMLWVFDACDLLDEDAGDTKLSINDRKVKAEPSLYLVAHNGQGYDFQLVYKWCVEHDVHVVPTNRGAKFLQLTLKRNNVTVVFRDTLCFFAMALASFPKTFGFSGPEADLAKGHFPHFFNKPENYDYHGPYPDVNDYGGVNLKPEAYSDLLVWLEQKRERKEVFHFRQELTEYCFKDTRILKLAVEKFRYLMVNHVSHDHDPITRATIASLALQLFIDCFMPGQSIAVLPSYTAAMIREAFYGGRTNGVKLFRQFDYEVDRAQHVDVVSMYPAMMYYRDYPVGHPIKKYEKEIMAEINSNPLAFPTMNAYVGTLFGVVCVDIEPPTDFLYLPPLPHHRADHKLVFDLLPHHRVTHMTEELKMAIEYGYRVTRIHYCVHFPNRSSELFRGYIRMFLALKVKSSGWPKSCDTPESRAAYLRTLNTEYSLGLVESDITDNPGLKMIAKMFLNSLWGKMGQQFVRDTATLFTSMVALGELLTGKLQLIKDLHVFSPHLGLLVTRDQPNAYAKVFQGNTNVALAVFTAAYGRMHLYRAMVQVQRQLIYFDTDSLIYDYQPTNPTHRTLGHMAGDLLGQFSSELEPDEFLVGQFVCAGPKCYGYRTNKGRSVLKVKGVVLSYKNLTQLDGSVLRELIQKEREPVVLYNYSKIKRVGYNHTIITSTDIKTVQCTYDKRSIIQTDENTIDTLPIGYEYFVDHTPELQQMLEVNRVWEESRLALPVDVAPE